MPLLFQDPFKTIDINQLEFVAVGTPIPTCYSARFSSEFLIHADVSTYAKLLGKMENSLSLTLR